MKAISKLGLVVGLTVMAGAAAAQDANALLQQLRSDDGNARREAVAQLARCGAETIGPLFELMGGEDRRLDSMARQAAEAFTYRVVAEAGASRPAVAEALAKEAASQRPKPVRLFALRMLGFVGGDEVVPTLAKLLADPEMHEAAREALARTPGGSALKALYDALPGATAEQKVGLINGLAARAQLNMLGVFEEAAQDKDEPVRVAAYFALSRMSDVAAAEPIRQGMREGGDEEKKQALRAYVRLGDTLLAAGEQEAAGRVFVECTQSGDDFIRAAGVAGIGRAGRPRTTESLLAALSDASALVRGAAKQGLVDSKAEDVVKAIEEAFAGAQPEARATLVWILGERRDPAGKEVLLRGLKDSDGAVRLGALRALGAAGDESTSGAIFEALSRAADREPPPDAELDAIEWALSRIPGTGTDSFLAGELICPTEKASGSPARTYTVMVRVMGNRRSPGAAECLGMMLSSQTDEALRVATIEAIGRIRDPHSTDLLIRQLAKPDSPEAQAAEAALARFTSPEAAKAMVDALAKAPDAVRAGILRALAPREDKGLVDVFMSAARGKSEEVAVAALDALGRLRDERAAPVFLEVAQSGADKAKQAAIRGYLRIAEARQDQDGAAALAIYQKALEIATGDDEKRQAILGIGRVGDIAQVALVEPLLKSDKLKAAAAAALVPLAEKVAKSGDKQRAVDLYRKAVDAATDRDVIRAAARKLRELGVPLDLAAARACITQWWVLGPFPGREQATKNDYVATDKPVDLTDIIEFANRNLRWKFVPVDDPLGMLDFEQTVARMDECGAYAYAEVNSDQERDVLFKIGSDDSVFCWLNGKRVHAWDGNRGWGEDQDTVEAHLKAGTNTILMKVINGGALWAVSLRITDKDGKPIVLEQRKP